MENKNIVLLKHAAINAKFNNPIYLNQVDDNLSDYVVVDVTSRCAYNLEFMKEHPNFNKELSPFFIGPVIGSDGVKANIFELFWQCGKVYPCHDNNGVPNEAYFEWRNKFYGEKNCSKELMRHTCKDLGYNHSDTLYFAYFDKEKNKYVPLNYIESRKKVYYPEYAKLVYNTDSYKWLKSIVDSGKKLALIDFDAYNYYSTNAMTKRYESFIKKFPKSNLKLDDFLNIKSSKDVINCPFLAGGHAVVLKMMLQGDIEVVDGKVIDHAGVLE